MVQPRDNRRFIAEVASAVAVVISLAFVGLEVRESARQTALNTQSLQVTAYQDLAAEIMALNMLGIENPEYADFTRIEQASSLSELTAIERERAVSAHLFILRHADLAYYQYELGMLPAERLESALGMMNDSLCNPLFNQTWSNFKGNFVDSFQEFVDAKIAAEPGC